MEPWYKIATPRKEVGVVMQFSKTMRKASGLVGCLFLLSVAAAGCGGSSSKVDAGSDGGTDGGNPDATGAGPHVLGFSGAGYLNLHEPDKASEFLSAMGYADENAYYDDVVSRMKNLSGPMARAEFFYVGDGTFVGKNYLHLKMASEEFEMYGWINPIPPVEGLDAAFEDALAALIRDHPEMSTWQVGNEPDLMWQDNSLYPAFFVRAQPVIRSACPACRIMLAGISNQYDTSDQSFQRYDSILGEIAAANLDERPFDLFDFHYYKEMPSADEIRQAVGSYRDLLAKHGLADGVSFWCTETGVYSGDPAGTEFGPRTEDDQARDLAKLVAWMATEGVQRVFFWTVTESWGNLNDFFDQLGLVYNGLGEESAHAAGTIKKAYTTYRLLAEALGGTTAATRLGPGVYRFDRAQGVAFVVWNEGSTGSVTLEGLPASTVNTRDLVPGDQGEIEEQNIEVVSGAVTVRVDEFPKLVTCCR